MPDFQLTRLTEITFQVKTAYLQFLLHCYIDTDAEMKDAYKPEYVDAILHNMLQDINKVGFRILETFYEYKMELL